MRTDLFDFHLPEERIALTPASPRDAARLLVVQPAAAPPLADRIIGDLPELLAPGDLLVLNDTRVIRAELAGERIRDAEGGPHRAGVQVTLHKRLDGRRWRAFARPAKRLKVGDRVSFGDPAASVLEAMVEAREDAEVVLAFAVGDAALDAAIAATGRFPLPPYIAARRAATAADETSYQTVMAARDGAVAAPTAGLHFTPELLARLAARGVAVTTVTLHVGAGTFLPMKAEDTADHTMHAEWGEVGPAAVAAVAAARARGGRVVAVGTTSLRLLESAADGAGLVRPFSGDTAIFITPGYRFQVVDRLLTNFHLPRSTLFMLVSAFSGLPLMQAAYAHAIAAQYRFYSYGDATLLTRANA
jgi:S-adenosylmethionine:tRNA ribosyltransferase-isomerase